MTFINRTGTNTRLFKKNKLYILHDIKRLNEDTVTYTFSIDGDKKEIKFKSFKQAEDWLQQIAI